MDKITSLDLRRPAERDLKSLSAGGPKSDLMATSDITSQSSKSSKRNHRQLFQSQSGVYPVM